MKDEGGSMKAEGGSGLGKNGNEMPVSLRQGNNLASSFILRPSSFPCFAS
jgi:hypothetical protein